MACAQMSCYESTMTPDLIRSIVMASCGEDLSSHFVQMLSVSLYVDFTGHLCLELHLRMLSPRSILFGKASC